MTTPWLIFPPPQPGGKLQMVIGLPAGREGQPLAVRLFARNTGDPATVVVSDVPRQQLSGQEAHDS